MNEEWRHPDLVVVRCMNCEKVTSFKSSSAPNKDMLIDKCGSCAKVYPNKVLRNNHWWLDGTPIGHNTRMTPEQLKYTVPTLERPTGENIIKADVILSAWLNYCRESRIYRILEFLKVL